MAREWRRRRDDGRVFPVRNQGKWDANYQPVRHQGHAHPSGALTASSRSRLSDSDFAIPSERKYPIYNKEHAANALARVSANGTPEEKRQVRAAVCRKYGHTFENSETCPVDGRRMNSDGPKAGSGKDPPLPFTRGRLASAALERSVERDGYEPTFRAAPSNPTEVKNAENDLRKAGIHDFVVIHTPQGSYDVDEFFFKPEDKERGFQIVDTAMNSDPRITEET